MSQSSYHTYINSLIFLILKANLPVIILIAFVQIIYKVFNCVLSLELNIQMLFTLCLQQIHTINRIEIYHKVSGELHSTVSLQPDKK